MPVLRDCFLVLQVRPENCGGHIREEEMSSHVCVKSPTKKTMGVATLNGKLCLF